jgi:small subunit ribosomal protein S6
MAMSAPIYDLMLLIDSSLEDDRRAKILADVEQAITAGEGSIELKQEWGMRRLAFEIAHRGDAEYHLLQFGGPPALVEALSYNLKITDGVLRHRIIKIVPGTPPAPEPSAAAPIASEADPAQAAPADAAVEPAAEAAPEAPAEAPEAAVQADAPAEADAAAEAEPAEAPATS